MKKIFILIIAFTLGFNFNSIAQNEEEIKTKLIKASEKETYLKDFILKIKPGEESISSVVLSKKTTYGWHAFIDKNKDLEIELLDNKENILYDTKLSDKEIESFTLRCNQTGVYHLHVKNNSKKIVTTGVLLTFAGMFEPKNLEKIEPEIKQTDSTKTLRKILKEDIPNEVFFVVEEMPKFKGKNSDEFRKFLQEEIRYPQEAIEEKIEGRVFVQFIVNKDGYIRNAKVARGVHPSIDQEALRVVYSSPKWKPGKQRGHSVDIVFTFPITFKLPD